MANKIISVTVEEAALIDWVLTLHSFDAALIEFLNQPSLVNLRRQAGRVITSDRVGEIELAPETLSILLVVVPITFRFSHEDVGYSLKNKLFVAQIGKPLNLEVAPTKEKPNDQTGNLYPYENNPSD